MVWVFFVFVAGTFPCAEVTADWSADTFCLSAFTTACWDATVAWSVAQGVEPEGEPEPGPEAAGTLAIAAPLPRQSAVSFCSSADKVASSELRVAVSVASVARADWSA